MKIITLIAVMGLALPTFAQDGKKPGAVQPPKPVPAKPVEKTPPPPKKEDAAQPGQDEMKQMMEFGAPTKQHEAFKAFEGTWAANVKMWEPGNPDATESKGTMTNTLIHGGRYVHHEFKGDFMGMAFTGSGDFGYDKATGKYVGTWMDSFGTAIMVLSGTYDEATKTYTSTGEFSMPGPDGKMMKVTQRETVKIDGPDKHTMLMYHSAAGMPEMKVMEITYTRGGHGELKAAPPKPAPKAPASK